ncbi:hypothetical protein PAXRUDRAFT_15559 [Paxillus rubicundulus Ve08.2h10]|uniref:Unplaced genomic scaffold scaffold_1096, whole genome shotgun sequence n=1 Tax=Paxillus rubicundulus Ve08.2h10 TaxID=930991 RepID=A0A0D0CDU3_9AGAM|nr:hypothetical protein PAXRUDRAFT_15559 [Paxillus rubicundulus Ve08.2h10]
MPALRRLSLQERLGSPPLMPPASGIPWQPSSAIERETSLSPTASSESVPLSLLQRMEKWANIVKGLAVDLDKVLGAHYSTEVDTKHSHDIGDLFQIAVKLPKQTKAIKSHGDWVITFGKTVQATSFALPQCASEYSAWLSYMSQLFASIHPTFHDHVIDFDKTVCLRATNQKHICLSDFAQFKDLQTIYLTSYGMGLNPPERTGGRV